MTHTTNGVTLMKDNSIKAVYDADLEMLLKRLGMYDDVVSKKCRCIFCGEPITLDTLDSIIPSGNDILFSCTSHACRLRLTEGMSD